MTSTTLLFNPTTKEISIHADATTATGGYRFAVGLNAEFALSNYNDPALATAGDIEMFITNLGDKHKAVLRRWGMGGYNPNVTVNTFELDISDGRVARVTQTTTHKTYTQNHIWWHVVI